MHPDNPPADSGASEATSLTTSRTLPIGGNHPVVVVNQSEDSNAPAHDPLSLSPTTRPAASGDVELMSLRGGMPPKRKVEPKGKKKKAESSSEEDEVPAQSASFSPPTTRP